MSNFRPNRLRTGLAGLVALSALAPSRPAAADDVLGVYVGAGLGQSQVEASVPAVNALSSTLDFKENHSGFKFLVGVRPITRIGAELEYLDFGHPRGTAGNATNDVSVTGSGAFGLLYLPVPAIDVFVKAGMARLQAAATSYDPTINCGVAVNPNCPYARLRAISTDFAAGAGAQFKLGSWAVRGEYEQFRAAGGNPKFLSVSVIWTP
jgi:opacity protein-like surface antigen